MDELHLKYVCGSCDWESEEEVGDCPECGEPMIAYYLDSCVTYETPDGPDTTLTWRRY